MKRFLKIIRFMGFMKTIRFKLFMKNIRSHNYPSARNRLDKQDELTKAQWLYCAEHHVCKQELYGPESEEQVEYNELVLGHLKQAEENYNLGEEANFEILRDQCAIVLECIQHDSFPSRLDKQVQKLDEKRSKEATQHAQVASTKNYGKALDEKGLEAALKKVRGNPTKLWGRNGYFK